MDYLSLNDSFWLPIYKRNGIEPNIFKGSVLYLGMGSCLFPRLQQNVSKTTIVEIDKKVIDWNKEKGHLKEDWNIINEDAFIFETDEKFDIIFIDIFYQTTTNKIMNILINKYSNALTSQGILLKLNSVIKNNINSK